jgi:hypothetical protein
MRFAKLIPMVALVLLLGAGAAHAQTTTGSTTPTTPNTGAGGNASENALMLTGTGVVALLGGAYLLRSRTR